MLASSSRNRRGSLAGWVVAMVAVVLLAPQSSPAQSDAGAPPSLPDHERRIRELEETVERLKQEAQETESQLDSLKPLAGWSDGFKLESEDGNYKMKIGGYTQFDGRFFASDKDGNDTNQFVFRRVRPTMEGTVAKYFDFKVQPDFAGANFRLFDAYVDINFFAPNARLRFGKYKPPLGIERLQSSTTLILMERGQSTNLVPDRDLGIDLWGEVLDAVIGYRLGIYNGISDATNPTGDLDDDVDFDGRLFLRPFKAAGIAALQGLGAGMGGSYGYSSGSPGNTNLTGGYRSFGQATIFGYVAGSPSTAMDTAFASGTRARINPSLVYYWGPFGMLTEYVSSTQGVELNSVQKNITNEAWMVGGSYVVTGEAASYRGVIPAEPLDPFDGNWGAFEVAARVSRLHIDNQAFVLGFASIDRSVRSDIEMAFGLNWYLNENLRFMLDYAQSYFDGGAPGGADRETEYVIAGRLQLLI
jgi:phosphate-selective porin OprO/OprP